MYLCLLLQGFIIVGASPHQSSSAVSSTHSGSYCSCHSHTHSSTGHTPPSSYGSSSMPKFHSLVTPFYQAPPTSQSSNGSTPSVKASDAIANSPTQGEQYRPRSHSASSKRRSSDPVGSGTLLSHTPPFGQLMQLAGMPTTLPSPYTSPYSTLSRHTSSSPSPSSLTLSPSSKPPPPMSVGPTGSTTSGRVPTRGLRYSLTAHGSGSKLSSLAEQTELETQNHSTREERKKNQKSKKTSEKENSSHNSEGGVYFDNLITASQILGSDDEEVNFPLCLSLHSSQSSNKTDEQDMEEEGCGEPEVETPKMKKAQIQGASDGSRRCKSAGQGVRRAASFSRQHSYQLTENFQQINSRAASLSAHQSMLRSDSSMDSTTLKQYDFQVSPAAKIKPVTPTFHLPSPSAPPSSQSSSNTRSNNTPKKTDLQDSTNSSDLYSSSHQEGGGLEEGKGTVCLAPLRKAMSLAKELVGMAKARQGPIMLLSTDLVSQQLNSTCKLLLCE